MIIPPCEKADAYHFRKENIDTYVPDKPGIYVFWSGKYCVYVGQAKSLKERLTTHWRKSHNDDVNVWIKALGQKLCITYDVVLKDLTKAEQAYINRLKPHLNKINARSK
jgi:excinuclease UvrABC nuclease subunit